MRSTYTMSETVENILVKDDRLGCITPKVKYQVLKGGQKRNLSNVQFDIAEHVKSCL